MVNTSHEYKTLSSISKKYFISIKVILNKSRVSDY